VTRGETPSVEELAEATGLELRHVEEALGAAEASISLNQTVGTDGDAELGELMSDPGALDPAEEAADSLRRQTVRRALGQLPEREQRILELRFGLDGDPMSLESIAKELRITRERVRQLEQTALAKLQRELEGVVSADPEADLVRAA
jgi:RNA polymerase primary sigma factor